MKKILKVILLFLFVALIIGTFVFLWNKSRVKEVEYDYISPSLQNIEKKTIITGTIVPRDEIAIKPQISGIIVEIYKEPGDIVKNGEAIAKVKVVPDIAQLNSAESQVKRAEINYTQVQKNSDRIEKLYQAGVASLEEYEKEKSTLETAKEELNNAIESLQIIKEGLSKSTAEYSNTTVRSTISGMILDIPVKVGNSVILTNTFNDGTTIATIADMNDLIFSGKIDETEVGKIAVGNQMRLIIGAMQEEPLSAEIEYIAPKGVLENGTTLFEVKAAVHRVDNEAFIRSGYSANGEIITESTGEVLCIPEYTLVFESDSTFVFVKDENNEEGAKKTLVTLGLSDGFYVHVKEGVDSTTMIRGQAK